MGSRQLGGSWLQDGLWKQLGIDETLNKLLKSRGYSIPVERLIFAMVLNRALNPSSKLAMEDWVANEVLRCSTIGAVARGHRSNVSVKATTPTNSPVMMG